MNGKETMEKGKNTNKNNPNESCDCKNRFLKEHEERVEVAVKESVARFVTRNRGNIRRSTKEQVATAAYGGGMVDMVMLVRSALGRWAVEQILLELEGWNDTKESSTAPSLRVDIMTDENGKISKREVEELGEQIVKWVEEKKQNGKKQCRDPMFA